MTIDLHTLQNRLQAYPTSSACFSTYVDWVIANVHEGLDAYDLIAILVRNDEKRLVALEERLSAACRILNISLQDFTRKFGFVDDLLSDDPEKIHDILAEPLFIVDLEAHGFETIQKIPPKIKVDDSALAAADFTSVRTAKKYAIELKTIRTETGLEDSVPFGDPYKSNWWGEMFFNNAVTKIEDKSRRAITQLENTKARYQCNLKMLVLYSRRLGPSTLLSESELVAVLTELQHRYPEIDNYCAKLYYGDVVFFPELD